MKIFLDLLNMNLVFVSVMHSLLLLAMVKFPSWRLRLCVSLDRINNLVGRHSWRGVSICVAVKFVKLFSRENEKIV